MVKGLPFFGMSLENAKPDFDMYDLFEEYGEHFMIDMGPGRGLMLTSRSGHDIREVMEQKAAIFQGYASSMNAFTSLKFSDHFGYMPRGTNGALRHGILCSAK